MFLGNEIKNKRGSIDWDRTYSEAEKHMAQVGLHESAQTLIKDIGTGKQQLVEIAKAFSKKVKLLILDEDVYKRQSYGCVVRVCSGIYCRENNGIYNVEKVLVLLCAGPDFFFENS